MKKTVFFLIYFSLIVPTCYGQSTVVKQVNLLGSTPSTYGLYDRFRLVPRVALTGTCDVGTLYVPNSDNRVRYCAPIGSGEYVFFNPWKQWNINPYNYDVTRVTLGTDTPDLKVTISDNTDPDSNADGGIIAMGTFSSNRTLATTGNGTRMIWYPKKAAFRAGRIHPTQPHPILGAAAWDNAWIGNYSVAFGQNNAATGIGAVSLGGLRNSAGGDHSIILGGDSNIATGLASTILGGVSNNVSGNFSIAGGSSVTVSGISSFAFGNNINVTQNDAFVIANSAGTLRVGIGTATPQVELDVNSMIRLTPNATTGSDATCAVAGSMYVDSNPAMTLCLCDGTTWQIVGGATGGNCVTL